MTARVKGAGSPGPVSQTSALVRLLSDPDWRVRREAALAIALMADPAPALAQLLAAARSDDVAARNAAIEALRRIGPPAVPVLLEAIADGTASARRFLIEALPREGAAAGVDLLRSLLADPDPNVPPAAAEALAGVPGTAASDALREALGHADAVVRLAALQAFQTRGEAIPWEPVVALVGDPLCGRTAVRTVVIADDPRGAAVLAGALSVPASGGARASAGSLAPVAVEALLACAATARAGGGHAGYRPLREALRARGGTLVDTVRAVADDVVTTELASAAVAVLGLLGDAAALETVLGAALLPELVPVVRQALEGFADDLAPRAADLGVALGGQAATVALAWAARVLRPQDAHAVAAAAWRAIDRGEAGALAWEVVARSGTEADAQSLALRLDALAASTDLAEARRVAALLAVRGPGVAARLAPRYAQPVLAATPRDTPGDPPRDTPGDPPGFTPAPAAAPAADLAPVSGGTARDEGDLEDDGSLDESGGEDALFLALETGTAHLRQAAARVLGWRGRREDPRLRAALADPDPAVVRAVLGALGEAASPDDLAALTRHDDPEVAVDALLRLRRSDPARAASAGVALLDHGAWAVRLAAVRTVDTRDVGTRARLEALRVYERDALVVDAVEQRLGTDDPGGWST